MNALSSVQPMESDEGRWKPYLKGGLFLLPAVCCWGFASVFMFPKLQQIMLDSGASSRETDLFVAGIAFLIHHAGGLALSVVVLLIAVELLCRQSAGYRRLAIGLVVFLLNSAIVVGLTMMCISLLLVAPALMHPR